MSRRRKNLLSSDKSGPDVLEDPTESRVPCSVFTGEKKVEKETKKEKKKRRSKSAYVERGWWVEGGG